MLVLINLSMYLKLQHIEHKLLRTYQFRPFLRLLVLRIWSNSGQFYHFIPAENTSKSKDCWYFQGIKLGTLASNKLMTMKLKEKRCIKDKIETRVVSFQFISSDFSSSILRTLICILKPINMGYLCLQGIGILSTPSRLTGFHHKYAN